MAKFRIPVIETCYGIVIVEAKDMEEAIDKAYCLGDDYFVNKSNVEVLKKEIEEMQI